MKRELIMESETSVREVIRVEAEPRMEFPEERISGALLPPTRHASATLAIIAPGASQTLHVHSRPDKGDEIIFVYRGMFKVVGEGWPDTIYNTDAEGPVYVRVPSDVPVGIANIGDNEVFFYTVFVPPFELGEIRYLE
jgi:oxalate decarboxylase/phosphoglucose isomerase-like protein (cupin superfamily)